MLCNDRALQVSRLSLKINSKEKALYPRVVHRLTKRFWLVKPFLKSILCLAGYRLTHSCLFCSSSDTNSRQKKRDYEVPLLISYRLAVGVALSADAGNALLLSYFVFLPDVLLYCFPSSISSLVVKLAQSS